MKESVVADSTCLIGLERIGRLDLLPELFEPILVPPEVQNEFGISLIWLKVETPSDQALVTTLKMLVDDGEAEALALAKELGLRIILDDRQARAVGNRLNIPVIGTVGILVQAKYAGVIPLIKPLLEDLESNGFYLSDALKDEALRLVGE